MTNNLDSAKKAKKEESPSNAGKTTTKQEKRKTRRNKQAILEIPYTLPPYTGGTGLEDADDIYEEMNKIIQEKTAADPTCWNGLTLISLKYEDGPHFASNRENDGAKHASNNNEDAAQQQQQQQYPQQPEEVVLDPACSIHIYGLPMSAGESDVRSTFSSFPIKHVQIPPNFKNPSQHRGMCFVEFVAKASADSIKSAPPGTFTICGIPVRISAYGLRGPVNNEDDDQVETSNNNNNNTDGAAADGSGAGDDKNLSRVATINNLVPEGEEIDADLIEAVGQDCSKYGEVKNILFYKTSDDDAGGITCAVEFGSHKEAAACVQKMNGRSFDKRILTSGLMGMEMYKVISSSSK